MAVKRGVPGPSCPALRKRRVRPRPGVLETGRRRGARPLRRGRSTTRCRRRRSGATRIVKGIPLADYAAYLDERATFMGQWGLRGTRGGDGPSYEELVETEGRPRLRMWLDRIQTEEIMEAAVVYGYWPC